MFELLAGISFLLGLVAFVSVRVSLVGLLIVLAGAPSGAIFAGVMRSGVYFADLYFVALGLVLVIEPRFRFRTIHWSIPVFLLVFAVYLAAALLAGQPADKYLVRELRIIVPFVWVLLFRAAALRSRQPIDPRGLLWLGLAAGAVRLVLFFAVALGSVQSEDVYYQETAYRYFDAGTYVCVAVLLVTGARPDAFRRCPMFLRVASSTLIWTALVVSGLRMLMFGVALAWVVSATTWTRAVKRSAFLIVPGLAFATIVVLLDVQRVIEQSDQEGLAQSFLIRFGPALPYLRALDLPDVMVGNGLRTLFEIPWFIYRSHDPLNNFVDSFYVTFFVKFGAVGIFCFLATLRAAQAATEGAHRRAMLAFLCPTMLVYSQLYLPHFPALLVATQMAAMALTTGDRGRSRGASPGALGFGPGDPRAGHPVVAAPAARGAGPRAAETADGAGGPAGGRQDIDGLT